ncbi:MAG: flagellar hook protein FlgE [Desulfuromonas sp.]|nr:flagellar hook protein FlgE [Desulfuromonas sp.]
MGIQSSLYSGVSGLNANGNALTVLGNNIANSNTIGFKASRTVFSDLLSAEIAGSGGTSQVGRGAGLSTVDNIFSQGTFESTESNTDLAIEGPGFFMVSNPNEASVNYTRAGAFRFDETGTLVSPEGYAVQGYMLNDEGETVGDITNVQIETRSFSPANPTSKLSLATNLNANDTYLGTTGDGVSPFDVADPADSSNYASSVRIFDSLGREHLATTYFNKLDPADNPSGVMQWEAHTVVAESEVEGPAQIAADDANLAAAKAVVATLVGDLDTANEDLADADAALAAANAAVAADDGSDPVVTAALVAAQATAVADQTAAAVAQATAQTTYDADYPGAAEELALAETAASDWVEVGRSILSFDTGGRLVNVKEINGSIADGPSDNADRGYDADGDLYLSSVPGGGYPLTTDVDERDPQPTVSTAEDALSWVNESDDTQQLAITFGATQYSSESDVISQSQDGYATGTLVSLTVDNDGNILGNYSNGEPRKLAKIALAKFSNPQGLVKVGNNMFQSSDNSGTPIVGTVGSGVGKIFTNSLEMSNVDLAQEFVKMITTQRGFQANSKIITTTDELLGELINLKR